MVIIKLIIKNYKKIKKDKEKNEENILFEKKYNNINKEEVK